MAHFSQKLVFEFARTIVESNAFENAIVHSANAECHMENVTSTNLKFKIDVSIENTRDLKIVIVLGKHYKEIQLSFLEFSLQ